MEKFFSRLLSAVFLLGCCYLSGFNAKATDDVKAEEGAAAKVAAAAVFPEEEQESAASEGKQDVAVAEVSPGEEQESAASEGKQDVAVKPLFSDHFGRGVAWLEKKKKGTESAVEYVSKSEANTNLILLIDSSSSMARFKSNVVAQLNYLLDRLKATGKNIFVTMAHFNRKPYPVRRRVDIKNIAPIAETDYDTDVGTVLYFVICTTLVEGGADRYVEKGERVICVVMTDGANDINVHSSRDPKILYDCNRAKELIARRRDKDGWRVLFYGFGPSAERERKKLGIGDDDAMAFNNLDECSLRSMSDSVLESVYVIRP